MLEMPEIDLVVIGVPNDIHCQIVLDTAAAGKHLVLEKPMCLNLAEADRMLEACRQAKVKFMYAEELCFTPKYVRLKKLLDSGALGEPTLIKQSEKHDGPHAPHFWDVDRSGGGVTMDMGCHAIEFFRWMLGRPKIKSVYAQMGTQVHRAKTRGDDNALIIVEFENGVIGLAEESWTKLGGMDDRAEVHGSKGVAFADLLHGNAIEAYSAGRVRVRRGKGRLHQGLVLPDLRGGLELRVPRRDGPFRRLRAERQATAGDRRRRARRDGSVVRRLPIGRDRPQGHAALPTPGGQTHRPLVGSGARNGVLLRTAGLWLDRRAFPSKGIGVNQQTIVTLDLEGVLVPEIWIAVAERTGIEALRRTTRDEPDYDVLMRGRIELLGRHDLKLSAIQDVIGALSPFDRAKEFLDELRAETQVIILSDTFEEFAKPLMRQLGWPTLFCHRLIVENDVVSGYQFRQPNQKQHAVAALKSLNYRVIAAGDSFNDTAMLAEADAGFLFHAPEAVIAQFPQFPALRTYTELLAAIRAAREP